MGIQLSERVRNAINHPNSIKVIASKDRHGEVHVVVKQSLSVNENGELFFLELLEGSQNHKNLTNSLWFNHKVAINIITEDKKSYEIKGIPRKCLVAGHEYEGYYKEVVSGDIENDLAAVYFIEPLEETEKTYYISRLEHEKKHPLYIHIDRLANES